MFNYTFKIKNHYELHIDEHSIKVTKEDVRDGVLVYSNNWSAHYVNHNTGEEIADFGFKRKKDAEMFLLKEMDRRNLL